jgi:hypothetical protein
MRIFLRSQAGRQGHYTPEELSILDQICKTATLRLGLTSREDIDDLAAGILSLYDMGTDDPEAILRDILLVFSTGQRLRRRGTAGRRGTVASTGKVPPKGRAFGR